MHRFFAEGRFTEKITIKKSDLKHIKNVLRLKEADEIVITDMDGKTAICKIASFSDGIELSLVGFLPEDNEPCLHVILAQGLGKGDKMDFVVQKAVELGVSEVVPLSLDRCVVSYNKEKALLKKERWQKIAEEAAKQSGRGNIPQVHEVMSLQAMLEMFPTEAAIVFYENEKNKSLRDLFREIDKESKKLLLLIGPEGGFSESEIDICIKAGLKKASLGKRILRTETAAVAALAVVMYELGDLGDI